jgi:PAS domain S-box-containing protein
MRRSRSAEVGAASATQRTAAGGRSGIGRLVPRLPILGDLRLGRRLGWVIPVLIVLVAAIIGYNARAIAQQRGSALVVYTAARQRAFVERYTTDVLLVVDGFKADPEESGEDVREPVDVLLDGGSVRAPQGGGRRVEIPPARDWRVRRKLEQDRRLIDQLIRTGDRLLDGGRANPEYDANVTQLRVLSAQLSSVSNDAVREITQQTEASLSRLVRIEIALGLLSVLAALALGLLLRRAGAEQAAQFRSLVNNSSDLITVLAPDGTIAYQSPSVQRVLGRRPADLVGTALGDLVHPDDQHDVNVSLTKLVEAAPGATANFGCRLEHEDGSWRHVESICTNLADDPRVHGLVLNIRDVTEQAALRQSIGDLLHNLARRSQGLVDRQLELIDELERSEVDPDRLDELFRMDHLATRMRRNVENLIVLSGVDQRRRWSESVPLRDVVEAAVAEVEDYSRVQVAGIHDLTLAGRGRQRRRPSARRAGRECHLVLLAFHQGGSLRRSDRQRLRARDRGPRDRDERRRAGRGQQAAGRAVGGRHRRVENDGLPRGRPPRGPPRHQGATPSLLVRRGCSAGAAASGPARLGWRTPGNGTAGAGRRHGLAGAAPAG